VRAFNGSLAGIDFIELVLDELILLVFLSKDNLVLEVVFIEDREGKGVDVGDEVVERGASKERGIVVENSVLFFQVSEALVSGFVD
jgi:hypothetical protein